MFQEEDHIIIEKTKITILNIGNNQWKVTIHEKNIEFKTWQISHHLEGKTNQTRMVLPALDIPYIIELFGVTGNFDNQIEVISKVMCIYNQTTWLKEKIKKIEQSLGLIHRKLKITEEELFNLLKQKLETKEELTIKDIESTKNVIASLGAVLYYP